MPTTPRGVIDYPSEGNTSWYSGGAGLENWLLRAELLGIPTYQSFSDLPSAGTTEVVNPGTGQDQRQFAAVIDDLTVYRDNGTEWVAWMNLYTDSEAVSAIEAASTVNATGEWTFEHNTLVQGSGNSEDAGDGRIAVQPDPSTSLDAHYKWVASDGSDRATWMYDQGAEQVRLWNYLDGENLVRFPLGSSAGPPNFPQGVRDSGDRVVRSSSGVYDVQKDGSDGSGVINHKTSGELTIDGSVVAQDDPENQELMGSASDGDTATDVDLTISDSNGYEYVELQCDIQGSASSATYAVFIQLNGDTGSNYEYNSLSSGSVTATTGAARFSSQMWGSNTERHRFAISAGSGQNHISQMVGSAENRRFLLNGDQTSTAANGPVTDIRVYTNFNAAADIYAVGVPGP